MLVLAQQEAARREAAREVVPHKAPKRAKAREKEMRELTTLGRASRRTQQFFDKHRGTVRAATVLGTAVGAVQLNGMYPEGLTELHLEASTVAAVGSGVLAVAARRFGYKRVASAAVDVTLGAVTGTVVSSRITGKTPMLAKKGPSV